MNRKIGKAAVLATVFGSALQAGAVSFDGDFTLGRRWNENKVEKTTSGFQANDYSVGAHIQPMAEIRVAVGLRATLSDYNKNDFSSNTETAFGWDITPEVKAWVPAEIVGTDIVMPYVKMGYTFEALSSVTFEAKDDTGKKMKASGEFSGYQINVGTDVKVTEMVGALVEYSYNNKKQEIKDDQTKIKAKTDITSQAFLIGARVSV
ncbi:MAG: outer membrane beta-barrel protein [Oligoflexales bacterium]|nr:outer membrane beta-barrel protein [Oligoflexales bacterium]